VYSLVSIKMDYYINRKRHSSINGEVKCLFVRENISAERQDRPTEATWRLEDSAVNHVSYRLFKIGHDRLLSNSSHRIFIQINGMNNHFTTTDQSAQFCYEMLLFTTNA
jgi:hypothetical protein